MSKKNQISTPKNNNPQVEEKNVQNNSIFFSNKEYFFG